MIGKSRQFYIYIYIYIVCVLKKGHFYSVTSHLANSMTASTTKRLQNRIKQHIHPAIKSNGLTHSNDFCNLNAPPSIM